MQTFRLAYALMIAKKISPPLFLFLAAISGCAGAPGDPPKINLLQRCQFMLILVDI